MTILDFQQLKRDRKKLAVVTAYDALFARIVEQAGIRVILVGDSLGMVVQGKPNTLTVTMDDMLYHARLVAGVVQRALVVADMPFMSYQTSTEEALRNAGRLLQAGAAAVKLEGGAVMADRIKAMTSVGIPVMGHLGMTPQSVYALGGYKVQGKADDQASSFWKMQKLLKLPEPSRWYWKPYLLIWLEKSPTPFQSLRSGLGRDLTVTVKCSCSMISSDSLMRSSRNS